MMEKLTLYCKKLFPLLLCFFLLLCGCSSNTSPTDWRSSAFSASLVYIKNETQICATVAVSAPREASDSLPRDLTLTLSSPEALRGLVITRKDGVVSLSYQGLLTAVEETNLLRCTELLLSEDVDAEIILDPTTNLPKEILLGKEALQISDFKKILSNE